jgi:hypothetical protein
MSLLLSLAVLVSCRADPPIRCASLGPAECEDHVECEVVEGRPVDVPADTGAASCYDVGEAQGLGCQEAGTSCPAVESFAGPKDGSSCNLFGGCTPSGWEDCSDLVADIGECG